MRTLKRFTVRSYQIARLLAWIVPAVIVLCSLWSIDRLYSAWLGGNIVSPFSILSFFAGSILVVRLWSRPRPATVLPLPDEMMPAPISVSVQIDVWDYIGSYILLGHYITIVFILVFLVAGVLPFGGLTKVIAALMLFLLVHLFSVIIHLGHKFKRSESLIAPVSYTFSIEGISAAYPLSHAGAAWTEVHQMIETRSYFFIVFRKVTIIIPKRFFASQGDIQAMRVMVLSQQVPLSQSSFFTLS